MIHRYEIVDKFITILETAAKHSLPLVKVNKNSEKRHSQIWFDSDCSNVRKLLSRLSHKTHKNPFDEQTRLEYMSVRRQYKQLLRHKKLKYRDNKIDELIKTRTSTEFWTNLRYLSTQKKASPDSNVPLRKLYNHFQQLHSALNADNLCEKQDEIIKELKDRETILSQFAELDQPQFF